MPHDLGRQGHQFPAAGPEDRGFDPPRRIDLRQKRGIGAHLPQDAVGYVCRSRRNRRVRFVVDTGASNIVLTAADARRAGFDPLTLAYTQRANTANGSVDTAPVTLDSVEIAGFGDEAVHAVVNAGDLDTSLLGMAYLSRYQLTFANDVMTLAR